MGWGGASTAGAEGVLGAVDFLPAGLGLSAQGALVSAGGELMGARVYDPVVGGFLAPDPLEPVAGAGWAGASCAFAGNDPVNLVDPTGLQPITVEQMKQYFDYVKSGQIRRDALNQFWEDIKRNAARFIPSTVEDLQKFWEDFWRDPVAWMNSHPKEMENTGLVIIATALLFTPAAPLAAGFLSEMGFSWLEQRWSDGKIDPTRLQIDGAIGAGSAGVLGLGARLYRGLRAGRHINFETSFGRASLKDGTAVAGAQRASRGSSVVEVPALFAQGSERQAAWSQLRESRYPKVKVEVRPVTGAGARSAVEVPPVAVSRVDVPRVAPVQGSGASRGGSQVPLRPVEAPLVGEVRPVSGVGSGAAGVQAVKPGGVADDAVAARGSAGGVREPEVQLKPVEGPKVENLAPEGREAVRVLRDDRSLQPIHSEVDKPAQQIMYPDDLKSWVDTELPQASRIGSASEIDGTPVRYHNKFGKFHDAKRDYYQGLKNGGVEGPRPEFSPWKAEKTEADYNTAFEGLSEVEKKKHSIISLDNFKGVIPQELKESVKSIWETGRLPEDKLWKKAQGPNEYENVPENKSGGHILPEKDVNGNPITYTEYDVKPPELTNKENGKLGLDRGKHRLVVGSNGSIYYSPDHYLTFIRLID